MTKEGKYSALTVRGIQQIEVASKEAVQRLVIADQWPSCMLKPGEVDDTTSDPGDEDDEDGGAVGNDRTPGAVSKEERDLAKAEAKLKAAKVAKAKADKAKAAAAAKADKAAKAKRAAAAVKKPAAIRKQAKPAKAVPKKTASGRSLKPPKRFNPGDTSESSGDEDDDDPLQ